MRLDGCNAEETLLVIRATITGALPLQEIACKADAKPQDMPTIGFCRGCSHQSCLSHLRLYCSLNSAGHRQSLFTAESVGCCLLLVLLKHFLSSACALSDCLHVLDQLNRTYSFRVGPIIDILGPSPKSQVNNLGTLLALHGDKQWWPLTTELMTGIVSMHC